MGHHTDRRFSFQGRSVKCLLLVAVMGCWAEREENQKNPAIYSLHIKSDVRFRFATTEITSKVANRAQSAKEVVFSVTLPKSAFMSTFAMLIDGKTYNGTVKEKLKAKQQYESAKRRGQTAGHVASKARNSNSFRVSINVAAASKVVFTLTYQELLRRKMSLYDHVINVNPGQVVQDLRVEVFINESRPIRTLRVPPLRKGYENAIPADKMNPEALITRPSNNSAHIVYKPSLSTQQTSSTNGVAGQFIVQYDVERPEEGGQMQMVDGYFVHFFAPTGLPPVPKNILFILDVSGSMYGTKIHQLKEAMSTILYDLQSHDFFTIITFSYGVRFFQRTMLPVNEGNIKRAFDFVQGMLARGGTNINEALLEGIKFLNHREKMQDLNRASLIIFLTDGDPTVGVTSTSVIQQNTKEANNAKYSLFSLGFGRGVEFTFLQKLSLQNRGFARKIYEDSDSTLQLQNFYREISTPVLYNVNFTYIGGVVEEDTLTQTQFRTFFDGSEIVIAGKVKSTTNAKLQSDIMVDSASGRRVVTCIFPPPWPEPMPIPKEEPKYERRTGPGGFIERLWAYLTIKELLDIRKVTTNATACKTYEKKALDLSLKYSFVTPLTSMVVTKPNDTKDVGDLTDTDKLQDVRRYTPASKFAAPQGLPGLPGPPLNSFRSKMSGSPRHRLRPPMGLPRPGPRVRPRYKIRKNKGSYIRKRPSFNRFPIQTIGGRTIAAAAATTTTTTTTTTTATTTTAKTTTKHPVTTQPKLVQRPHLYIPITGSSTPACFNLQTARRETVKLWERSRCEILVHLHNKTDNGGFKTFITKLQVRARGLRVTITRRTVDVNHHPVPWRQKRLLFRRHSVNITDKLVEIQVSNMVQLRLMKQPGSTHFFSLAITSLVQRPVNKPKGLAATLQGTMRSVAGRDDYILYKRSYIRVSNIVASGSPHDDFNKCRFIQNPEHRLALRFSNFRV